MAAATIEYQDHSDERGFYVTFDEAPDPEGDWEGPFQTQEEAQDYATSILEAAAVAAVKSMFG